MLNGTRSKGRRWTVFGFLWVFFLACDSVELVQTHFGPEAASGPKWEKNGPKNGFWARRGNGRKMVENPIFDPFLSNFSRFRPFFSHFGPEARNGLYQSNGITSLGPQQTTTLRLLSATLILSKHFCALDPTSRLKSVNLSQNQLKIGQNATKKID